MITKRAVITHQQGSWKWQKRYELALYTLAQLRSGKLVWKKSESLNTRVTLNEMNRMVNLGIHYGSLHMKEFGK